MFALNLRPISPKMSQWDKRDGSNISSQLSHHPLGVGRMGQRTETGLSGAIRGGKYAH